MGNKAEVTKNAYEQEYRSIYFSAVGEYLTQDNIAFHIREKDIAFLCVDNHATRKLVVDECQNLDNVILISGGNDYYDGNVSVYIRVDGVDITNPPTVTHPEIAEPKDKNPGTLEQREGGGCANEAASAPQLLITNNIIAAFMLSAFLQVVEGKHGNYGDLFVDAIRSTSRHNDRGMPKAATRIA
jgi:molybdopterin/thiamine biosynthesis adenylyltransferase